MAAQARKDDNRVNTMIAISNADGTTSSLVSADPITHGLTIDNSIGGSDLTGDNALRDDNRVTTLLAVSSSDGVTPVPLYVIAASGSLLIKST